MPGLDAPGDAPATLGWRRDAGTPKSRITLPRSNASSSGYRAFYRRCFDGHDRHAPIGMSRHRGANQHPRPPNDRAQLLRCTIVGYRTACTGDHREHQQPTNVVHFIERFSSSTTVQTTPGIAEDSGQGCLESPKRVLLRSRCEPRPLFCRGAVSRSGLVTLRRINFPLHSKSPGSAWAQRGSMGSDSIGRWTLSL